MRSDRHREKAIDNLQFATANRVKSDDSVMWRVRSFQAGVCIAVLALALRLASMAGMQIPSLGG